MNCAVKTTSTRFMILKALLEMPIIKTSHNKSCNSEVMSILFRNYWSAIAMKITIYIIISISTIRSVSYSKTSKSSFFRFKIRFGNIEDKTIQSFIKRNYSVSTPEIKKEVYPKLGQSY